MNRNRRTNYRKPERRKGLGEEARGAMNDYLGHQIRMEQMKQEEARRRARMISQGGEPSLREQGLTYELGRRHSGRSPEFSPDNATMLGGIGAVAGGIAGTLGGLGAGGPGGALAGGLGGVAIGGLVGGGVGALGDLSRSSKDKNSLKRYQGASNKKLKKSLRKATKQRKKNFRTALKAGAI